MAWSNQTIFYIRAKNSLHFLTKWIGLWPNLMTTASIEQKDKRHENKSNAQKRAGEMKSIVLLWYWSPSSDRWEIDGRGKAILKVPNEQLYRSQNRAMFIDDDVSYIYAVYTSILSLCSRPCKLISICIFIGIEKGKRRETIDALASNIVIALFLFLFYPCSAVCSFARTMHIYSI